MPAKSRNPGYGKSRPKSSKVGRSLLSSGPTLTDPGDSRTASLVTLTGGLDGTRASQNTGAVPDVASMLLPFSPAGSRDWPERMPEWGGRIYAGGSATFDETGGRAAVLPSPATNNGTGWKGLVMTWIVPVIVGVLVWWFTGGIGWAIIAAIVAWFLLRWWNNRTTPAPTKPPA